MPKMIVSIDGIVIKEVQLTKERTSLGRRPYNDIVIDNLAVSGEHAVVQMTGNEVHLEDLNSTNGTYVNSKAVKKQLLVHNDVVEIGKYKIKFVSEAADSGFDKTTSLKPGLTGLAVASSITSASASLPAATSAPTAALDATIRVMTGAAAGREVPLIKVVTTIGKPGVAVAAITRRPHGFVIAHVEGINKPLVNGTLMADEPVALKNGDLLELAGTQMQFVQH